jgi:hypothetical protein
MADKDLEYKITTKGDPSGALAVDKAVKQVDKTVTEAGKGAEAAASQVNSLGENFEKGAAAGRVLGEVSRGNILALGQLSAAIKVFAALIKTNLVGVLITLGAVAANVFLPMIKGWNDTKKKAEEAEAAISSAREEAKKLGEQDLEGFKRELDGVKERASEAVEELERAQKMAEAIAAAQDDLDRARIDANPNLSEAQRSRARGAIDDRASVRQSRSADERLAKEVGINTRLRDETQRAESAAAVRQKAAAEAAERAARALADIEGTIAGRRKALQEELGRLNRERSGREDRVDADAEIAAVEKMLDSIADDTRVDVAKDAAASAEDLAAKTKLLEEANRAALQTANDLAKAEAKLSDLRKTEAAVRPLREEARKVQGGSEVRTSEAAARKRRGEIDMEALEAAKRGDYGTVEKLGAERAALDKSQAALDGVADAVKSQPAPQPLDVSALHASIVEHNGKVITYVNGVQTSINDLAKQVKALGQRLDNERQKASR